MRDYKPRPREKKRKPVGGTLLGIFIGLVLGLAIATVAAIYVTNAPVPFVNKAQTQRATPPQADQKLAGINSPLPAPKNNADGSVTVWFAPTVSAG